MQGIKKKHHYIAKYYLKNFTDTNGKIWVYKKDNPINPHAGKPNKVAIYNKLYHLENSENSINEVEDYFANKIEGPAVEPFKKLIQKQFPSDPDREKLSLFFGTQIVRVPRYIHHLKEQFIKELNILSKVSASNREDFYRVHKKLYPELDENEIEKDRQDILNGSFSFEPDKKFLLKKIVLLGKNISLTLFNMRWALIETDEKYPFITSDNFTNIFNPQFPPNGFYQPGLGMPGTRFNIPLSKNLTLLMINDEKFHDGSFYSVYNSIYQKSGDKINLKELIKAFNKTTYLNSDKYIFTNSDSEKLKVCFSNLLKGAKFIQENKKNNSQKNEKSK